MATKPITDTEILDWMEKHCADVCDIAYGLDDGQLSGTLREEIKREMKRQDR